MLIDENTNPVCWSDVDKIVKILKAVEGALSDGYKYYCGNYTVDEQLEWVAKKILDIQKGVKYVE